MHAANVSSGFFVRTYRAGVGVHRAVLYVVGGVLAIGFATPRPHYRHRHHYQRHQSARLHEGRCMHVRVFCRSRVFTVSCWMLFGGASSENWVWMPVPSFRLPNSGTGAGA